MTIRPTGDKRPRLLLRSSLIMVKVKVTVKKQFKVSLFKVEVAVIINIAVLRLRPRS